MAANDQQASSAPTPASTAPTTATLASAPSSSPANIITALGNAFKSQNGEPITGERIAQLLAQNMGQLGELARQGKLNAQQIQQVCTHLVALTPLGASDGLKEYAERYKTPAAGATTTAPGTSTAPTATTSAKVCTCAMLEVTSIEDVSLLQPVGLTPTAVTATTSAFKSGSSAPALTSTTGDGYPISQTLATTNPGPVPWPAAQQGRPTLTGGMTAGRISGTPAQVTRSGEETTLTVDGNRTRRKNTPGDQSMRRSIQDVVLSVDPNVRIEPEVEDLLLQIADEFIDSVTNFGCRLAKHRGSDSLEVKDLQLHLERNHNIRIPGFASDDTRISLSQSNVAPPAPTTTAKKSAQGTSATLRSQRLAQVQQAKREGKLL
ncbi:transcription initiation factor TFIID subunit A-domain-containing protein [Pisolithus albus]|nr:transcription initiation factor TFIID subunit A-domain-containing protein [Pisolithus albus]